LCRMADGIRFRRMTAEEQSQIERLARSRRVESQRAKRIKIIRLDSPEPLHDDDIADGGLPGHIRERASDLA
jgi:hypothetical protein